MSAFSWFCINSPKWNWFPLMPPLQGLEFKVITIRSLDLLGEYWETLECFESTMAIDLSLLLASEERDYLSWRFEWIMGWAWLGYIGQLTLEVLVCGGTSNIGHSHFWSVFMQTLFLRSTIIFGEFKSLQLKSCQGMFVSEGKTHFGPHEWKPFHALLWKRSLPHFESDVTWLCLDGHPSKEC